VKTEDTPVHGTIRTLITLILSLALIAGVTGCKKPKQQRLDGERVWTPNWYSNTSTERDGTLVETAQATMATFELAEMAAVNAARQNMALTIEGRVDVLQRAFQEQVNAISDADVLLRFQNANAVVASTTLRGSSIEKKETFEMNDGNYRCYVMLELDAALIDKNYLDAMRDIRLLETRLRSSEAWAELERRAQRLRDERNSNGPLPPMTDDEINGG
jgi:hypothetical protein